MSTNIATDALEIINFRNKFIEATDFRDVENFIDKFFVNNVFTSDQKVEVISKISQQIRYKK
jgi:hypothetical protein